MTSASPQIIHVKYDAHRLTGRFERSGDASSSIWDRLKIKAVESNASVSEAAIEMPWSSALSILREYGTRSEQQSLNFKFLPEGAAIEQIKRFGDEMRLARAAKNSLSVTMTEDQIKSNLADKGWDLEKRDLREFQIRDLQHLLALSHGANFSVPGAGKTTVTFALYLLVHAVGQHLLVIGPKASFPAWKKIVAECMSDNAGAIALEPFTVLDGSESETDELLRSGATRFLMSYDLMVRQQPTITAYLARHRVHLVLDEAHRMKAGSASQRGAFLLSIATLPARRDILTGTPMPQGTSDISSQLQFLHPGQGYEVQIQRGVPPREVLGKLYVRTTKHELGLPPATRHFLDVEMASGQLALYATVRHEALRQLTQEIKKGSTIDFLGARRSVMRLLQLSVNPILALTAMSNDVIGINSGIADQVLEEGPSLKMRAVADHARRLAKDGKRSVIWTIFTDTISELERMLADLNPVSLYGAVPSGGFDDPNTREGRLERFHNDPKCMVMIANPAAAGEGISLHTVCHNALYVDRSYVSTHYLQSIDRIHRLGLKPGTETNIYIYRTKAPPGLGSVDYSVSRRLLLKLNGLQQLLDDPDLKKIALDEENADDPVDFDVDMQDLVDLVEELEGKKHIPTDAEEA